jgi:hypothetical protein
MKKFLVIAFTTVLLLSGTSMVNMSQEEELPPANGAHQQVATGEDTVLNVTWA